VASLIQKKPHSLFLSIYEENFAGLGHLGKCRGSEKTHKAPREKPGEVHRIDNVALCFF
jgi:hypothetical protein